MTQSKPVVLVCGNVFGGVSEGLSGRGRFLVQDGKIAEVAGEVNHPPDDEIIDLSERTGVVLFSLLTQQYPGGLGL